MLIKKIRCERKFSKKKHEKGWKNTLLNYNYQCFVQRIDKRQKLISYI